MMAARYRFPEPIRTIALPSGPLSTQSDGFLYPSNSTQEAQLLRAGCIADPLVTAGFITVTGNPGVGNVLTAQLRSGITATALQWMRNGAPIGGATATTYVQTTADSGAAITVAASGLTATSLAVTLPTLVVTGISGIAAAGNTLSITGAPVGATYQWTKNGVNIAGATSATYSVQATDGVNIRCIVNGALSGPATYLGQVGTRCFFPTQVNAASNTLNARVSGNAHEAVTGLQFVFPNLYAGDFSTPSTDYAEHGPGAVATLTAALEYPAGTFTQIKWSGSASTTIADGALSALSDICAVSIPAGARYWVRPFLTCASGVVYAEATPAMTSFALFGEGLETGTGLADKSMGGTVAAGSTAWYGPVAVVAQTTNPSVAFFGDSRDKGEQDTLDATGYLGFARALSGSIGVMNMGIRGDSPTTFLASAGAASIVRRSLVVYASHIVTDYGVNDYLVQVKTQAQALSNLQALWTQFGTTRPIFQTTIGVAGGSSTDNWTTLGQQTVSSFNAARTANNDVIRTTPAPLAGFIELADTLESSRNSGLFVVNGTANYYTSGGTHPSQAGYLRVRDSGCFSSSAFIH